MAIKVSGTEVISDDKRILNNEDLPDIRPSLLLDFANSKTLDPRITFTRGSTATYWDGKTTAKAEENLLIRSQEFDRHWSKLNLTVTADAISAPDGTTTADKIEEDSVSSEHQLRATTPSVTSFTASVYAKADERDKVYIQFVATSNEYTFFDLTNGTVAGNQLTSTSNTASRSSSIVDVGNGWYRCSISVTLNTGAALSLRYGVSDTIVNSTPSYVGTTGSGIYIWGAQLEQRSSATAYTATTSSSIVKYQPVLQTAASGEARFDHDPVTGESKGLLIEEARTNAYTYSVLSNANWEPIRSTLTESSMVAPDGTLTATKLTADTQTATHYAKINTNIPTTATYTLSFYVKAAERDEVGVWFGGGNQVIQSRVHFNLTSETINLTTGTSGAAYGMEDVGNGWYRIWLSDKVDASFSFAPIVVLVDGSNYNVTGDGYSGIHVWGAQLEEGSFPTSYIPTSGSTVTRAGDDAKVLAPDFAPLYNPTESTMFAEFSSTSDDTTYSRIWDVGSSSTPNNRFTMFHIPRSSSRNITVEYRTDNSGVAGLSPILSTDVVTDAKVAATWAQDDFAVSANGNAALTDTSGSIQSSIPRDTLGIGGDTTGGSDLNGHIKKIAYYPKRLPNATLQAMTEA